MYLSTCKKISSVKIFVITGIMLVEMIECRRKTDDGREENVCSDVLKYMRIDRRRLVPKWKLWA